MRDNGKIGTVEQQEQLPPKENKLIITVIQGVPINVTGPINDEPLALWMLDKAKDIIKAYNLQKIQPRITPARGGIMNFIRGKK